MYTRQIVLPLLLLCGFFVASLAFGTVAIPLGGVVQALLGQASDPNWATIVWDYRLPKALTAVLAGASLAVSGLQMQTLFRNPLAGPYVLGVTAGANLGVAMLVLASGALGSGFAALFPAEWQGWALIGAAIAGAGAATALVLLLATRLRDNLALLIVGLMLASGISAVVGVLQYFSQAAELQRYVLWTFGSLGGLDWQKLRILALICGLGLGQAFLLFKPLNAWVLGEQYARSLGVAVGWARFQVIVSTSLLAGSVTAFCGPIGFVGLAVPYLARLLYRTADHRVLLPASAWLGAVVLLACDLLCQTPGQGQVLPINIVTSLLGAPAVIWIVLARRA
jgi:iron complex transport system permease protein